MARYRKKLVDAASSHEKDIRLLWEEIRKLELQRKSIAASAPTTTTPWNVAAEYFRLFRHGYSAAKPLLAHESCVHLDFLRATMAPDVVDITSPNVEAMLENWRQFTLCYQDMDTTLVSLETCGESVIATSKTTLLITESALHSSFPQVVSNLQADQWRLVAAKLVGKTLEMNGVVRFDWDPATGRVVRMEYNTDMLTALLSLLGNVDDLSTSLSLLQRVL
ncbi:hypothetical protein PHYBOEH_003719 [Phytophthora boehmeriae]|uniref:Bzip transcription factor n=1 Tax=Phytophthora boehmeriae TaxID=109152 RepID=A0A8T1WUK9_9STRA|nr:hypothetical protein PHYBOEH_003719 [Phytophthora boehmeriae]